MNLVLFLPIDLYNNKEQFLSDIQDIFVGCKVVALPTIDNKTRLEILPN